MIDYHEAAAARAAGVSASADRPTQRSRTAEGGIPWAPAAIRHLSLVRREATGDQPEVLEYDGYASVVEAPYTMYDMFGPYTEVVSAEAFDETLNRADLDVPLVIAHDQTRRIARTTTGTLDLSRDDTGLRVRAELDPADPDVSYIGSKLRSGLIDEMSFAFRIDSGRWSPDYTEFRIEKVDLHRGDVAIVGWGANPATSGGVRAAQPARGSERVTDADLAPRLSLVRPA